MRRRGLLEIRRGRRAYVSLALAPLAVLGALSLGPRIGPFGLLSPLPAANPLDYSARPGFGFTPLSARYLSSVLGEGIRADGGVPGVLGPPPGATAAGAPGATATRLTDVHPLTNDDITDARFVPSVPFTAKTDTSRATRESSERDDCATVGSSTVWYRYTPTRDIGLIANTFGSSYATALGVFRGKPGSLTRVGCDTDAGGNAIVAFPAKKEATHYFQITGPAGGGDLVFNLEPHGVTRLASVDPSGASATPANNATISADGRFVAFDKGHPVDSGDRDDSFRVFVRDTLKGRTTIASVNSSGKPANGASSWPYISPDGRFVTFESNATDLVPKDTNDSPDIFVHDLVTRRTERVSVTSTGRQLEGDTTQVSGAYRPSISWKGEAVAFETRNSLAPDDRDTNWDIYVHDRRTRVTERVTMSYTGGARAPEPGTCLTVPTDPELDELCKNGDRTVNTTLASAISPNGRYVRFNTGASNVIRGDTNGHYDTFVHDRVTHRTERVSLTDDGKQTTDRYSANEFSPRQGFSFDGRFVVYTAYHAISGQETDFAGNNRTLIYVFDRETRRTTIANLSSSGVFPPPETDSGGAAISSDGRYVAFHSAAANLTPGDDNEATDIFLRDLLTRTTVRVSVTSAGQPSDRAASHPVLSAHGERIAYEALAAQRRGFGGSAATGFVDSRIYVLERTES